MNIYECRSSSNSTRNKMRRRTEIQGCLPDDLLIKIFLFLPADILYNVMRFVCRKWYDIIQSPSFISMHLQNSTVGLYINDVTSTYKRSYILKPISDHGCGVEVKELKFKCACNIKASCNGLVFILGPGDRSSKFPCYVANLVTKQQLPLPLFPCLNSTNDWYLAYTPASRVYKIVYIGRQMLILTVGVDHDWRKVDISQLTSFNKLFHISSIRIGGFVYWVQTRQVPFILSFNMETETFNEQLPLPPLFDSNDINNSYYVTDGRIFKMGSSLCLCEHVDIYSFQLWLLKDPKSGDGQWKKLPIINLKAQDCAISRLIRSRHVGWITPCGLLRSGELLVLRGPDGVLLYNIKTGQVHKLEEIDRYCWISISYGHVESLVPLNNLFLDIHPRYIRRCKSKLYSKDNMRLEFEEPS